MESANQQTRFWSQLRKYGVMKIIKSLDFKISFLIFVLLILDHKYSWHIFKLFEATASNDYITGILAASATLFALTITALSIILSFSSSKFVQFLQKNALLNQILFPFWLGNGAYLASISISMLYLILGSKFAYMSDYLLIVLVTTFCYALTSTFYLLATIIRFGFFLSYFEEETKKE